jgi:hypothetical protein
MKDAIHKRYDIMPRNVIANPKPERITAVVLYGCEFVIGWDGEPGEDDTYCDGYVSVRGCKPTAWVECVKLDGKWWEVSQVFSSDFCDQLDAALKELDDFGSCA